MVSPGRPERGRDSLQGKLSIRLPTAGKRDTTLTRRIHVTGWQGKVSTGGPTKTPVSLRGTLTGLPSKRSGTFAISLLLALPGLPSAPSIAPTNGAHRDEEEEYRALDPKGVLGKTDDEIKHLSLEDKLQYARDFPTRVGTELTSKFS